MESRRDRMRMDAEGDRLSVLPDDLILQILSFMEISLDFNSSSQFLKSGLDMLSEFVTHVLSRRNNQVQLSSFNLYLRKTFGQDVALRIMNHAFSLNVQQLNVTCRFTYHSSSYEENPGIPYSLSGSLTLKHLTLNWYSCVDHMILTSTREFSSLTTLHLYYITLYDGFLSMYPNLENLTLNCCKIKGSEVLSICHPRLSNLTLENGDCVNVVTPQLKNLTISNYFGGYQISAPELASLIIKGQCMFSTDGFPSLEKAQFSLHNIKMQSRSDDSNVIRLLQEFRNVQFLSLSEEVIQVYYKIFFVR
ncbi:putative leucine-rich repeat domain superfamily [Helianthus annuus]|uniref:Leucine-rich repeat domain superfamily n=1 Tax=Helianthus annuus TaxID=4232 RepID=A0A9K3IRA1_HELAN|nr:putative leucine-rich repeat domain superfamily [Helianthus annuus]KAJ0566110.1 putative leucine-rich repeat domain superfamily [Helianthus annuus]KAJ0572940.1 putative leucine-rich repeat domain superfamily [Helianthus annuus]KAJ0737377.1 putative leucine-rich repeat domain superfamily [Helianthus annuus]KAJ0911166.1 putative leucine-rich repeat domain superfamily [Helianthus annuus]